MTAPQESPPTAPEPATAAGPSPAQIDVSCRVPLLVLFLSAAVWFLVAYICALLCSIKFHASGFLAAPGWLTYGRLWPASRIALLYGAGMQAGLGVGLWLLARLGRAPMRNPLPSFTGAFFWNLGVTVAFIGILHGDSTGFENLELPSYSVLMMFVGYLLLAVCSLLLFHRRRERRAFPSQWFIVAALFWFAWIFSTAELVLVRFPVRGVAQSVIAWWYADNLRIVWFGLTGLAAAFYFVPKLVGRELRSHYLALFIFWMLILCGSWGGVPDSAPVPAWMPAVSTVARVLMLVPVLAVAVALRQTAGCFVPRTPGEPALPFILFGIAAFVAAGLLRVLGVPFDVDRELHFTWFASALSVLQGYGFFAMIMFGAIYYILPRLLETRFLSARLVRTHFWLAALGVVLLAFPLALAGLTQFFQLRNPDLAFVSIVKATLPFLRVSTMGDLLLAVGHVVFLVNLSGLVTRYYRARAAAAYSAATADLFKRAEAKA
jgi:cytochrome c oxidase cbb3-type subunit 1